MFYYNENIKCHLNFSVLIKTNKNNFTKLERSFLLKQFVSFFIRFSIKISQIIITNYYYHIR